MNPPSTNPSSIIPPRSGLPRDQAGGWWRHPAGSPAAHGPLGLGCPAHRRARLVNAPPARNVAAQPSSGTLSGQTLLLDYTVDPARTGPNTIHLYALTRGGQQQNVVEMTMTLSLPAKGIASLPVPLQKAGPGHFQSLGFVVPIPGSWEVRARARTSDIDADTFFGSVRIR